MSRLESMRRRLTAQIDGINWAVADTANLTGDVLDVGLGNGRTYDHLRQEAGNRRIWVIDRALNCHPDCVPPSADYLEGEADAMLKNLAATDTKIAFCHYDLGTGVVEDNLREAKALSPLLQTIMVSGGVIVSSQPLVGLNRIDGPGLENPDRYFFYRT